MGIKINDQDYVCYNCGNDKSFFFDKEKGELVCLNCGMVIEELVWRENRFEVI